MNPFKNEKEIILGSTKILLRPTFENIAAMEQAVGSVTYLSWKFSRGARIGADGKIDQAASNTALQIQSLPSMSECAKIIFYNQAECDPENPTRKKYSLEQIWEMLMARGGNISSDILNYVGQIMAGDKTITKDEVTDAKNA